MSERTDVVCSGCGVPIRDGFCGLNCSGRFEGIRVVIKPRPTGLTYIDDFGHDWSKEGDKSAWPPDWTQRER